MKKNKAKFKVGDEFTDVSTLELGIAMVMSIDNHKYYVRWSGNGTDFHGGEGTRSILDGDLRPLTKLERALK